MLDVEVSRNVKLGRKIKAVRAECGLRQKDLAKLIDVAQQTVAAWESGKNWISLQHLLKICEVCRVRLSYFDVLEDN